MNLSYHEKKSWVFVTLKQFELALREIKGTQPNTTIEERLDAYSFLFDDWRAGDFYAVLEMGITEGLMQIVMNERKGDFKLLDISDNEKSIKLKAEKLFSKSGLQMSLF